MAWYTDWLLDEIINTKNDAQFFKTLSDKYPEAGEIAYSLKLTMKQLMAELINRKKQNNEKDTLPN